MHLKPTSWTTCALILLCFGCTHENTGGRINLQVDSSNENSQTDQLQGGLVADRIGWPNIYGPYHNSISREQNVVSQWTSEGPARKWSRRTGSGYSAPVSAGEDTIVMFRRDKEEIIECIDTHSGQLKWEHRSPTDFVSTYEYSNGPYSTPTITNESVIAIGAAGQLNCLSKATGNVIWSRDFYKEYEIGKRDWPFAGSPLILDDRLILNLGAVDKNAGVIAVDLKNGQTIWEATNHGYAHTTPTVASIHGQKLVFVLTFEGLVCLNPDDGKVFWEIAHQVRDPRGINGTNAVSPVVIDDRVCIVSGPKVKPGLRCIQILPNGEYDEPWNDIRLLKSQYTNLVGAKGFLFAFTPMTVGGPTLKCIDIINGKLAWKGKPDLGRGNMLAVNDSILILGEDGTLASFELSTSELVEISRTAEPVLEKPCFTSMALNQGLLFARNEKELICFDLNATPSELPPLATAVSK